MTEEPKVLHEASLLAEWCKAKAVETRRSETARLSEASMWGATTDAEWKAGRELAERMTGRPALSLSRTERREAERAALAIAGRYANDAERFDACARLAAELAEARAATELDRERLHGAGFEHGALLFRHERLVEAARALLTKLAVCEAALAGIYSFAHVHGMQYDGPDYVAEREALRDALEGE